MIVIQSTDKAKQLLTNSKALAMTITTMQH